VEYFNSTTVSAEEIVKRAKNEPDEFRKVRLIHDWVADIFAYDAVYLRRLLNGGTNAEFTLQEILRRQQGVCLEYAVLFWFLADASGLDVYLISDYSKPGIGHAYNMVIINGTGYVVDTTWDSGTLDRNDNFRRQFGKDYFMSGVSQSYRRRGW
jgi:transglutaminase/protease-like cytokinesis protein 3